MNTYSQQYARKDLKNSDSCLAPLVSWILCTNVGGELLHKAINSCFDQTYKNFELILVINGTNVTAIKKELKDWEFSSDPRLRVFETDMRHLPFSLSLGLNNARGDYIARMDGDDISYPHRLSTQIEYMKNNPDISVLGTAFEVIDLEDKPLTVVTHPLHDKKIRKKMIFKNPICHPTVMFKREVILAAGGYLGALHAEDYDLWIRLSLCPEIKFANLKRICLGYRHVGIGTARKSRDAYASMASSQLRSFLMSGNIKWILAIFISIIKSVLNSFRNLINKNSLFQIRPKKVNVK